MPLESDLAENTDQAQEKLRQVILLRTFFMAEQIRLDAEARAPVRTGRLSNDIKVSRLEWDRIHDDPVGHQVTNDVWYGWFHEFGWTHNRSGEFVEGNPFMRPAAWDNARDFSVSLIRDIENLYR